MARRYLLPSRLVRPYSSIKAGRQAKRKGRKQLVWRRSPYALRKETPSVSSYHTRCMLCQPKGLKKTASAGVIQLDGIYKRHYGIAIALLELIEFVCSPFGLALFRYAVPHNGFNDSASTAVV